VAELTPFSFRYGNSMLFKLDVRCKFFAICLVSICILSAKLYSSLAYCIILLILFKKTNLSFFNILRQLKLFFLLLFFIVLSRALVAQGDLIFSIYGLSVTKQGFNEGVMVAFKFLLIMLTGILFSCTTNPSSVKSAVQWFLKPVPFIPENRTAAILGLSIKFMPVILKELKDVSDAQKARCGDLEKNPVKRIVRTVIPLLKKAFISADHLVLSMESRCYTEKRTDSEFSLSGREFYFVSGSLLTALSFLLF
jgi:energy-coupling factor transporter transmembrane protein EcfT